MESISPIKKIVVIGPESTGKTSLCQQLADHFHTDWCPEFARDYLLKHGMDYSFDDLLVIAKGQVASEEEALKQFSAQQANPAPFFIDTDMYVMKVWCEFVFGKCHQYILEQIVQRQYDLYLLCEPDLPWIKDELREYPDPATRTRLYSIYKDCLINQSVPWVVINGSYEERLVKAISEVNRRWTIDNLDLRKPTTDS